MQSDLPILVRVTQSKHYFVIQRYLQIIREPGSGLILLYYEQYVTCRYIISNPFYNNYRPTFRLHRIYTGGFLNCLDKFQKPLSPHQYKDKEIQTNNLLTQSFRILSVGTFKTPPCTQLKFEIKRHYINTFLMPIQTFATFDKCHSP